jgi:AcrR family transcriptional regulator
MPAEKSDKSTRAQRLREASQQRREQERQEVRRAILQAASELFMKHGYQNFSLRQVAEQIGYSPGTIYLYFADKDAILMAIMAEGIERFTGSISTVLSEPDPRARLAKLGRAYIDFGLNNPAHFQLMFMQRPDFLVGAGQDVPPAMLQIFGLWRVTVENAMNAGVLRRGDPGRVGDAFWALLHGVVSIAILMPRFDKARIDAMADAALELITHGLHE